MTELLSIIDADDGELEVTEANNLRWEHPIEGAFSTKDSAKHERLMRSRPFRYVGSRMEQNTLKLSLGVMGHDRDTLKDRVEALRWRMDPDRGQFQLKRTLESAEVRQCKVALLNFDPDHTAITKGGPLVPVTATVRMSDLWFDPTTVTVSGAFNGGTPVNLSCASSNVGAYVKVTIAGAVDTPKMQNADGDYLELEDSMGSGDSLVTQFDPGEEGFGATMTPGSGSVEDWTGKRSTASKWWVLPVGTTNVTLTATSGTAGVTIEFDKFYRVPA